MNRYPVGFYALGMQVAGDRMAEPTQWSTQGLVMLEPGTVYQFTRTIDTLARVDSVHCWGLCRLVDVRCALQSFAPEEGALFVLPRFVLQPGMVFAVHVEVLQFEPLAELRSERAKASWDNWDETEVQRELAGACLVCGGTKESCDAARVKCCPDCTHH